mgnify:FL=1
MSRPRFVVIPARSLLKTLLFVAAAVILILILITCAGKARPTACTAVPLQAAVGESPALWPGFPVA